VDDLQFSGTTSQRCSIKQYALAEALDLISIDIYDDLAKHFGERIQIATHRLETIQPAQDSKFATENLYQDG